MAYRILALDGGGIRGLLTAVLLERLVQQNPNFLDNIDLVSGTSTGGILALGLAHGMTPTQLRQLYYDNGHLIFDRSWIRNIQDVGGLAGAKYDNSQLKSILSKVFGNTTLADLSKKVLIPTFNLDDSSTPNAESWTPKFFHNFPGNDSDGTELAADVALRTSAAPTYFPSAGTYIDGGVVANNPSVAAMCQALDSRNWNDSNKISINDIIILSLGTGKNLTFIKGIDLDWGIAQWGTHLINILTDGVSDVSDYECKQILGDRYQRVEVLFPASITFPLDDVTKLDAMIAFAENINLSRAISFLTNYW